MTPQPPTRPLAETLARLLKDAEADYERRGREDYLNGRPGQFTECARGERDALRRVVKLVDAALRDAAPVECLPTGRNEETLQELLRVERVANTQLHERMNRAVMALSPMTAAADTVLPTQEESRILRRPYVITDLDTPEKRMAVAFEMRARFNLEADERGQEIALEDWFRDAAFLLYTRRRRESSEGPVVCVARKSNTDPPQDCDWPFCGCDAKAARVIGHLEEMGWLKTKTEREKKHAYTHREQRWICRVCKFTVYKDLIVDLRECWCHTNAVGEPARNAGVAYCPRCDDETLVEHPAEPSR